MSIVIISGEQASGKSQLASLIESGFTNQYSKVWKIDPIEEACLEPAFLDAVLRYHRNEGLVIMVTQRRISEITTHVDDEPRRGWGSVTQKSLWGDVLEIAMVWELVRTR